VKAPVTIITYDYDDKDIVIKTSKHFSNGENSNKPPELIGYGILRWIDREKRMYVGVSPRGNYSIICYNYSGENVVSRYITAKDWGHTERVKFIYDDNDLMIKVLATGKNENEDVIIWSV
jgi:hypothetical protein